MERERFKPVHAYCSSALVLAGAKRNGDVSIFVVPGAGGKPKVYVMVRSKAVELPTSRADKMTEVEMYEAGVQPPNEPSLRKKVVIVYRVGPFAFAAAQEDARWDSKCPHCDDMRRAHGKIKAGTAKEKLAYLIGAQPGRKVFHLRCVRKTSVELIEACMLVSEPKPALAAAATIALERMLGR